MITKILITLLSTNLLLAACAPAVVTPKVMMEEPTEVIAEKTEDDMMDESSDEMMDESTDKMMEETAWFGTTFTNVSTGETFTINDFKGKVVLVENLAMWCSNCKKQQEQVKLLHELLGMNEDLVSIGLDIDTNENASDLKTYVENNGFDWIYAVASEEVTREIANLYGAQFLNPPSTPILIIDRKGQAHPMPFGIKSAEELKNFIEPFLSENM